MSDNLLDRMVAALRRAVQALDPDAQFEDVETRNVLAEVERVKARTVVLTFEPLREMEKRGEHMLVLFDNAGPPFAGVYTTAHQDDGDYAYAVLPPLPGPEVFK